MATRASIVGNGGRDDNKSIGVVTDITGRKAAERANAELAAIVESADTAIFSKDLSGKILTWNAGAEADVRLHRGRDDRPNMDALFPADRASEEKGILETLGRGQRVSHMETVRLTRSSGPIPVLVTASPVRNAAGEVVGSAHINLDISER